MTIKTFWTILIKIVGLYLICQILILIPTLLAAIAFVYRDKETSFFSGFSATIVIISSFILVIRYCIFHTDRVIEKLRLEKGLEEETLTINIHRSGLLSLAIIVVGGLMVADSFPLLVRNLFLYFQNSNSYEGFRDNGASPLVVGYFLKLLIGYFMVTDSRLIVNFIERKRRNNALINEEQKNRVSDNHSGEIDIKP